MAQLQATRRPLGYAFLISTLATASLVVATMAYAGSVAEVQGDAGRRVLENDQRILFVRDIAVPPGWGAPLDGYIVSGFWVQDHVEVDFYVVGEGDAQHMLAGRTPGVAYLHYATVRDTMYGTNEVIWPKDGAARLEYVWMASDSQATSGAREALRHAVPAGAREHEIGDTGNPVHVVDPKAAPLLPWLLGAGGTALACTLVTGALWFRRSKARPSAAEGLEAMAMLVARGERFLVDLRNLLRIVALLLICMLPMAFWFFFSALWNMSASIDWTRYMPLGFVVLMGGSIVAYLSLWLVWARHYLNVRREIKRWTAHSPEPDILG